MYTMPGKADTTGSEAGTSGERKLPSAKIWRRREDLTLCIIAVLLLFSFAYYLAVWQAHRPSHYAEPLFQATAPYKKSGPLHVSTMTCHGSSRLWSVRIVGQNALDHEKEIFHEHPPR